VDLVAISAHKFGGPKGTGALVVRGGVALEPLVEGGGQERGLRSGTSNVAGAVAMAAALRATCEQRAAEVDRIAALRDRLVDGLLALVPHAFENGDRRAKVAGNAHVGFAGVEAETLLVALDQAGVWAAAGSSCSSGATEPSHVLAAMGVPRERALSSIRLSLGFASTDHDVDVALDVIPRAVEQLRRASSAA
jgi:cysteine desulfurase